MSNGFPVTLVTFPETRVAALTYRGPPGGEDATARRLVAWKLANGFRDALRHRHYGLHYTDPRTVPPDQYRVDLCLSVDDDIAPNPDGIFAMTIPARRCALARDVGSRHDNRAARWLYDEWLPRSGERLANAPVLFHYVNVGPGVRPEDAITDVYLPLEP